MDKCRYEEYMNAHYESAKEMSLTSLKECLSRMLNWSEARCCGDDTMSKEFSTYAIAEIMGFVKYLEEVVEHADRPS